MMPAYSDTAWIKKVPSRKAREKKQSTIRMIDAGPKTTATPYSIAVELSKCSRQKNIHLPSSMDD